MGLTCFIFRFLRRPHHGHVALGEHSDITPDDVKQILRLAR